MYWLQWVQNFSDILDRARFGTLRPDWRDGVTLAFPLGPMASTELKDSAITAVLDIVAGARRPWEPGAPSRGWQDSLESWRYDGMLAAYSVLDYTYKLALHRAHQTRETLKRHYAMYIATGAPPPQPQEFTETDHLERCLATELARFELLRRYHTAIANAEYRAGLVAGGVELQDDWLTVLRTDLANLPDMTGLRDGPDLAQVRTAHEAAWSPGYRAHLETLPTYWLKHT